ncbi:iron complex transport system ATP-binding protein [Sinosporangium album]|uniref:Iron complex transport system ATP-binding protein n=1 Tax=Sinosporangium album TaxID=504805 RepID=A0A1G7Y7L5_9ACTN|nr:ATP-binding cassette domain-containing protein [Sinosporangium album]SDG92452.1 iron complex transport system ATP-binding protein [Sinosporangium album]
METSPALEFDDVTIRVVGRTLISEVAWKVAHGEHWVVLGPNGAGKTTLLSVASAVQHPSSGAAWVLGHRLGRVDMRELRSRIGLVAAGRRLVDEALMEEEGATAEAVVLTGHTGTSVPLWDRYGPAERERASTLLASLGCGDLAQRPFTVCSQGERARIRVARALMGDPGIVLLDEPFAGLDLPAREDLIEALEGLKPTSVLVTHHLEEVPATTTHALLVKGGGVLAQGPVEEILTGENLSECFGRRLLVDHSDGRWHARAHNPRARAAADRAAGWIPGAAPETAF